MKLIFIGKHSKEKCFKTPILITRRECSREDSGNSHIIGSFFDFRSSLLDHAYIFP